MEVDVVVVNYNTAEHLRVCLTALTSEQVGSVVVVDNCSEDTSREVLSEFPTATLLEAPSNLGYGAAANLGIQVTSSRFVTVLNADVVVDRNTIDALADYLEHHSRVGIAGPPIIGPDRQLEPSCGRWPTTLSMLYAELGLWRLAPELMASHLRPFHLPTASGPVDWVLGAVMMIRREAIVAPPVFDPAYFLYLEEVDLSRRLRAQGWETHWVEASPALHVGGASGAAGPLHANLWYFRSMALYQRRRRGGRGLLIDLRLAVLLIAATKALRARLRRHPSAATASWAQLARDAARGWR